MGKAGRSPDRKTNLDRGWSFWRATNFASPSKMMNFGADPMEKPSQLLDDSQPFSVKISYILPIYYEVVLTSEPVVAGNDTNFHC